MTGILSKRNLKHYSFKYMKFDLPEVQVIRKKTMRFICEKIFFNGVINPSRLCKHLRKIHLNNEKISLAYFLQNYAIIFELEIHSWLNYQ